MGSTPFYELDQRDGTGQSDRFPYALADGYFDIDERSEAHLLGFAQAMARNLRFCDLDGATNASASWADLFAHDPLFVLADISNTNTGKLERANRVLRHHSRKHGELVELLHAAVARWNGALRQTTQPQLQPLASAIGQFLRNSLNERRRVVAALLEATPQARTDMLKRMAGPAAKSGPTLSSFLEESVHQYIGAIDYFKSLAAGGIDPARTAADQNPAVALYVAFLRLYRRVQDRLNTFPRKRIDFYYQQLLGAHRHSVRSDTVHLALTLAPGLPPALVPAGTRFPAGKDNDERDLVFASDEDIWLTDARVADLRVFNLDRNPQVSPHNVLGYVTRASVQRVDTETGADEDSLFGARHGGDDARIGLAIASGLLEVGEGARCISLSITCRNPAPVEGDEEKPLPEDSSTAADLVAVLANQAVAETQADAGAVSIVSAQRTQAGRQLVRRLGQILAREIVASDRWLSATDRVRIGKAAVRALGEDCEIPELLAMDRAALFYRVLRDALQVHLSGADGWVQPSDIVLRPLEPDGADSVAGLRIIIELSADEPAIVACDPSLHGDDLPVKHAVLRLCANPKSVFYAYSLLSSLDMEALGLTVQVRGARRLSMSGDLGPLDASKPFVPFGPQPGRDSYFAVGLREAATKPLTAATLNIEWSGLPQDFGGFESHYRGYPAPYNTELFLARTGVLGPGGWRTDGAEQPLFRRSVTTGQVCADMSLDLLQGQHFSPLSSVPADAAFRLDNLAQGGFFRVDLSPCDNGFGHAQYPQILTEVLMHNARRRKTKPVPNLPYTPMINSVTMDYAASESIRLRSSDSEAPEPNTARVFHLHPFGIREVSRHGRNRPVALMPHYFHDGYMLIGLSGEHAPGTLSLLFGLAGGQRKTTDDELDIAWYYVTGNELRPLPRDAVLRDTTAGLTASGVVTLVVPEDIDRSTTVLPSGLMWLAVAARGDLRPCPQLRRIATGAVRAERAPDGSQQKINAVRAGTITQSQPALPFIGQVRQPAESFSGREAEDRDQYVTRVSERLHHKNRACQVWDYERLVLEHFPDLHKVKCFANMRTDTTEPAPGHVLIVVVPKVSADEHEVGEALVNPQRLSEIRAFLAQHTSAFATVSVRNAAFELVQIRCSVQFRQRGRSGHYIRQLQQRISRYISPWQPGGYGADFGWRIRRKDIEACIGESPDVAFVTDFSMLHITRKMDSAYCLLDTARPDELADTSRDSLITHGIGAAHPDGDVQIGEIKPRYPWSLALPSRRHFIRSIDDLEYIKASPTGVGELEIGNTLILDSEHHGG